MPQPPLLRDLATSPPSSRSLREETVRADLVVVGGGLAGLCAAVTAARAGAEVALIQDRPVLGGNASSEVRLWALGATCHMGSNNRWSREGGLINELMLENLWRNREGNPILFDTVLLEAAWREPRLRLLLNTSVCEAGKAEGQPDRIAWVRGYCSQTSTWIRAEAPLFCDASGDGVLGFLAGASFHMGAEGREAFDEPFAPDQEFGALLGHSIYFYTRDTGQPVAFVPPAYALDNVPGRIPRYRSFDTRTQGCRLWWIEHGGRMDTVHDTERIKWELWQVVYGVWDYIKNSGEHPEAANLTLEWVGAIPGKRESRRFLGPHVLCQKDVVERTRFPDAVAHGGWSIDLHPADGVFSKLAGSHHLHSRAVYSIPYRCYFSRDIRNLFLAGRIISASHVAFGSTRVMCTCAVGGQAVGMAAAHCRQHGCDPADLLAPPHLAALQRDLLRNGQFIPGMVLEDPQDLVATATLETSSTFDLAGLPGGAPPRRLDVPWGQWLPASPGRFPDLAVTVDAESPATLTARLRTSVRPDEYSPEGEIASVAIPLEAGAGQGVVLQFGADIPDHRYVLVAFDAHPALAVHTSPARATGLVSVHGHRREETSTVGGEDYEVWSPERRPGGHNLAFTADPPIAPYPAESVRDGSMRPTDRPHAWVADPADADPSLTVRWDSPQTLGRIVLAFDADYDHALETVQWGHPERAVPFCPERVQVSDAEGRLLAESLDHHQAQWEIAFPDPVRTAVLRIRLTPRADAPAALVAVRAYAPTAP